MSADTCILFFSRTAQSEGAYKSFTRGKKQNQRIIEQMIRQSQQVIKASGLPYFMATEATQQGANFGSRLAYSLAALFAKGFSNALIVGNDCLQLKSQDLIHAAQILATGQQIIGPTHDGGAYLIGISKEQFNSKVFEQLPWESAQLYTALKHYFQQQRVGYQELQLLSDVDDRQMLQSLLPKLRRTAILKSILDCLQIRSINTLLIQYIPRTTILHAAPLRAPPFPLP